MVIPPDLTGVKDDVEDRLREIREYDDQVRRDREEGVGVPMEL